MKEYFKELLNKMVGFIILVLYATYAIVLVIPIVAIRFVDVFIHADVFEKVINGIFKAIYYPLVMMACDGDTKCDKVHSAEFLVNKSLDEIYNCDDYCDI